MVGLAGLVARKSAEFITLVRGITYWLCRTDILVLFICEGRGLLLDALIASVVAL